VVQERLTSLTHRACNSVLKLAALGLLLALGTTSALAADDDLLSRLQGEWIGQGLVKIGPGSRPERVYCKIANKLVDGGNAMVQKGRCAVDTNSGSLKIKIVAVGDGRYEGTLNGPHTVGPATLAGHSADGRIVLAAEYVDRFSRRPTLSIISLIGGDGDLYQLTSDTLNPASGQHYQAADIIFKPHKKKPKSR
jgi:hypothetical protein